MAKLARIMIALTVLLAIAGCNSPSKTSRTEYGSTETATTTIDPCATSVAIPPPLPPQLSLYQLRSTPVLSAVSMASSTDGWAVGGYYTQKARYASDSLILHYVGGRWTRVGSPTRSGLRAIAMVSANEGWAVGDQGVVLHLHTGIWSIVYTLRAEPGTTFIPSLESIAMVSANEGWVVGESGTILHLRAGVWQPVSDTPVVAGSTGPILYSISMLSSTEGWVVGVDPWVGENRNVLLHYADGKWQWHADVAPDLERTGVDFTASISMVSAREGWIAGTGGIAHYCGGRWTVAVPSGSDGDIRFRSVFMSSASEGWAVGWQIWRLTNRQWTQVASPVPLMAPIIQQPGHALLQGVVESVVMVSTDEGWAVGYYRSSYLILHYQNGSWSHYQD